MTDELEIGSAADTLNQLRVIVNRKGSKAPDIDVIYFSMKSIAELGGKEIQAHMTPDEALELANRLTTAVQAWLTMSYKPYDKDFNKPRERIRSLKDNA